MSEFILFFTGIVVGLMNAIAGGGLLIGFPIMLAVGMPPLVANITGHLVVLPGTLSASYSYRKYLKRINKLYAILLIPIIIGGAIGALLLRNTSAEQFREIVPVLVFAAVILFIMQPLIHLHLNRHIRGQLRGILPLMFIGLALLPVAIYGGYFGAGFGFIMLAFLGFTKLHEIHQMTGLKNLAGLCLSVVSLIFLYPTHLINWRYGVIMSIGGAIGSYYGANFSQKISSHSLRIIVVAIGICTASYLAFHSS